MPCHIKDCPLCNENFKRLYQCASRFITLVNTRYDAKMAQYLLVKLKDAYYNYSHPYTTNDHPVRLELRHSTGDFLRATHCGKLHRYHLAILQSAVDGISSLLQDHDLEPL